MTHARGIGFAPHLVIMLIAHVQPPSLTHQGDQYYRTTRPCAALGDCPGVHVVTGSLLHAGMHKVLPEADLLVLCQSFDADLLPLMLARRAAGKKTVVEINDNFCAPQPFNPVSTFYKQPQNRALIFQMAQLADGLQFSSAGLQARFGYLNPAHAVFVNQPSLALDKRPYHRPALALGWAGSLGHRDDLLAVVPALREVLQARPDIHLAIMGPEDLRPVFDWVPSGRLRWRPAADVRAYQAFLQTLDVGIAPLLDTPFNRDRSDVKFLEYASSSVAFVGSCNACYSSTVKHDLNGLLVDGMDDFAATILRLCNDDTLAARLRQAAHATIATRSQTTDARQRLDFYASLGCPRPSSAIQRRGCHALAYGDYEQLLFAALSEDGGAGLALNRLKRAQKLQPDDYRSYLYAAPHLQGQGAKRALQRAVALQPQSCVAHQALGDVLAKAGDIAAAQHAYEQCVACAPIYAPPHEGLARLALQRGETQAAVAHLKECLRVNPNYRTAAARLAVIYMEAKSYKLAAELLRETIEQHQPAWLEYYLLGDTLCHLRRFAEALRMLELAYDDAPDKKALNLMRAKAMMGQGQYAKARDLLQSQST